MTSPMDELRQASADLQPASLSPAAQAVLDIVREICPAPADEIAAAALRAAADQVVPHEDGPACEGDEYQEAYELAQSFATASLPSPPSWRAITSQLSHLRKSK